MVGFTSVSCLPELQAGAVTAEKFPFSIAWVGVKTMVVVGSEWLIVP